MKTRSQKSKALPVEELLGSFEQQVVETARRSIAMRRQFPGVICRWKRAARTGPNSDLALIITWPPGQPRKTEIWPFARSERLAAEVTDEEVFAELGRRLRYRQEAEGDLS
jgi:hypothetical protein